MTTYRDLSRPLRLAIAAPSCLLLGLACAAAPAFRQVLLDPTTNQPTAAVSLSGSNWTGTLDAARLPTDPTAGKNIAPAGIDATGVIQSTGGFAMRSGSFSVNDLGLFVAGNLVADGSGGLFAAGSLSTPTANVTAVQFPDGSQLHVNGGQLVWTQPDGSERVLTVTP